MEVTTSDGGSWRIGTDAECAWIADGTSVGLTITSAIPPVFDSYATIVVPEDDDVAWQALDRALVSVLRAESANQRWWLGYLNNGADDVVFPEAPRVSLYANWHYVLVEAGPEQALTWRKLTWRQRCSLPDLIFPTDRGWLVSRLFDDDWICVGGPAGLVDKLLRHPDLETRRVELGQDATPPGHIAI
ncbi:hypothetical protein ACWEO2_19275 [Nocardia sp. NPDC004278]